MEKWQILYLSLLALGFIIGWLSSPFWGVAFVWTSIIVSEIIRYLEELMEFELELEES